MMYSIIIPVYNTEKYINKCVSSVLNQSYDDFEIIIVDDGSESQCAKYLDEYSKNDFRIKVIHQKNKGLGGARNTGIKYAIGDYLFFLDSDDFIEQKALEISTYYLNQYNLDVLAYDLKLVNEEGVNIGLITNNNYIDKFF